MVSLIRTEVYFIRHGIAAERGAYANDADRPLVAKGLRKTQQVAERIKACGVAFDLILTSPLVRAKQTADLLKAAELCSDIEEFLALSPGGQLEDWLTWLADWQQRHGAPEPPCLALVGHEPDLSQWAQQLVQGQTHDQWVLKKAGIIGLSIPDAKSALGNSDLFLLVPPRFFIF